MQWVSDDRCVLSTVDWKLITIPAELLYTVAEYRGRATWLNTGAELHGWIKGRSYMAEYRGGATWLNTGAELHGWIQGRSYMAEYNIKGRLFPSTTAHRVQHLDSTTPTAHRVQHLDSTTPTAHRVQHLDSTTPTAHRVQHLASTTPTAHRVQHLDSLYAQHGNAAFAHAQLCAWTISCLMCTAHKLKVYCYIWSTKE